MENSQYNFSVYKAPIKNIIPVRKFSLENIHRIIISEKYKEVTKELRNTNNKANRNIIKASKLDYVTFSGLFEKRALSSLKTHSNLFCIDLDDLNNVEQIK